jgi:hypothetical protein
LKEDGVVLRALFVGHVDLPARYKAGLEGMLAEELASEKMRFTLELKEKKVKETALEAMPPRWPARRPPRPPAPSKSSPPRSQAEAMKHILPLKQKEIEQRRLEAEARKVQRMKDAEGEAEARRIESQGEADARRKLSDAEAYKIEVTGKATLGPDGARFAPHRAEPAAHPEDARRQAVRQDPGRDRAPRRELPGRQPAQHAQARRQQMTTALLLIALVADDATIMRNAPDDAAPRAGHALARGLAGGAR